jgi:acetyl-CoA carboxylase biotin carboxyl carrier protein
VSLTAKDVAQILELLEQSSFDSLDLEMDGMRVQLRRRGAGAAGDAPAASLSAAPRASAASAAPPSAAPASAAPAAATFAPVEAPPGSKAVTAPLLGVFYRAPKPGEPPFVEVGARVAPDTVIGIIEVMKLMNTVRAGMSGQVVAIPARNGELVEFGETLLFVRED